MNVLVKMTDLRAKCATVDGLVLYFPLTIDDFKKAHVQKLWELR
jgi:hypothetical protein